MTGFFENVARRIDRLDAENLRLQYENLAADRKFFEALVNSMHEGVAAADAGGRLVWANPAAERLAGFSLRKARGKPLEEILPGFAPSPAPPEGQQGWARTAIRELEIEYPERKILSVETTPMEDGCGEAAVLILLRDVTAERAREADALESGRTDAVHELAAGVAHEIGNPLNALTIHLQLLERDLRKRTADADCARWLEDVKTARSEIGRVDAMIRDFLTALRPVRPVLAPGSLADPLKDTLSALKGQIESRRIRVAVDLPSALPKVLVDRARMEQVFFNIVKNAMEAMKDGSLIEIALRSDDTAVEAEFRDHGQGMDAGTLSRIFEPYRTTKSGGHGLGLAICRRIVQAHGGEIDVVSKPGEGTAFTVRLPRIEKRIRRISAGEK